MAFADPRLRASMARPPKRPEWRDALITSPDMRTTLTRGRSAVRVGEVSRMQLASNRTTASTPRLGMMSGSIDELDPSPRRPATARASAWPLRNSDAHARAEAAQVKRAATAETARASAQAARDRARLLAEAAWQMHKDMEVHERGSACPCLFNLRACHSTYLLLIMCNLSLLALPQIAARESCTRGWRQQTRASKARSHASPTQSSTAFRGDPPGGRSGREMLRS